MILAKPSRSRAALADLALDRPEDLARRESWSTNPPALARLMAPRRSTPSCNWPISRTSPGDYPGKAAAVASVRSRVGLHHWSPPVVGLHSAGVGTDQLNGFMRDLVGMGAGNVSVSDLAGTLGIKALPGGGLATSMLAKGFDTAVEAFGTTLFPDGAEGAARGQAASIEDLEGVAHPAGPVVGVLPAAAVAIRCPWFRPRHVDEPQRVCRPAGRAVLEGGRFDDPLKDMSVTQRTAFTTWVQSPTGGAPYITMPQQEALQSFTAQYEPLDRKTR